MKNTYLLSACLITATTLCLLVGCGESKTESSATDTSAFSSDTSFADADTETTELNLSSETATSPEPQTTESEVSSTESTVSETPIPFSFSDVSNSEFWFSSGAGGWATTLTIQEDGTFEGEYHDSDMGSIDTNYPNGTLYLCNFVGKFAQPEMVNEYTFSCKIEHLNFENTPSTEEIIDGVRTIYTTPYGIDNTDEVLFYTPDAPISELPQEYLDWVFYPADTKGEQLSFYGIYNTVDKTGFSSYLSNTSSIDTELEDLAQQASILEEQLQSGYLSQVEMNQTSYQLYMLWDDELNSIWERLKTSLDATTMDNLTVAQRKWIEYKESEIIAAGIECEGGSMQPLLENDRAAELTRTRVYELAEYLRSYGN